LLASFVFRPPSYSENKVTFDFNSRRSPVLARNGMVAASQPLAAIAGLRILMQGGNAADAVIATAAALNVTEPTSTGIGGDCFALFYDANACAVTALNGSGRAPAALTIDLIKRQVLHQSQIANPYHAHTITVPGACAGWFDLIARHGTMPMRDILAPAIELAEKGFPVAPTMAYFWQRGAERQLASALGGRELTIDGRGPNAGEIFRNPRLAHTFRAVAEGGKDAFYKGGIAQAIARVVQQAGGVMTTDDLAAHESTWDEPISTTYRGVRVWECPPNGQGLAALIALNVLEGFDLASHPPLSAERLHLLIEAMRVAFADTRWYVADPQFSPAPLDRLLSKKYAAERRALIDPRKATLDTRHGAPSAALDTVYFAVVDGKGNACSFINAKECQLHRAYSLDCTRQRFATIWGRRLAVRDNRSQLLYRCLWQYSGGEMDVFLSWLASSYEADACCRPTMTIIHDWAAMSCAQADWGAWYSYLCFMCVPSVTQAEPSSHTLANDPYKRPNHDSSAISRFNSSAAVSAVSASRIRSFAPRNSDRKSVV
jgi:gamma-glutamyltranspeptidase